MDMVRFSSLDGGIKNKAERFFGLDFGKVAVGIGDRPSQLGARACAHGDDLYFQPECADFSRPENLALLGHELTHIAQQRQGRVRAQSTLAGMAFTDDPALEAEAWRLGWRFANGQTCDVDFSNAHGQCEPLLQRAVIVGTAPIEGMSSLEPGPATVLQLIEGGPDWVNWAAEDMNVRYQFENQLLMTQAVQIGLHGVPLLLLNKLALYVSPLKLLTLDQKDFKAITDFELGIGNQRGAKMFAVNAMRANNLLPQGDLEQVDAYLQSWKMTGQPVFQALGLMDKIALYNLGQWVDGQDDPNPQTQRAAANFAVGLAQSPMAFVDYFQYYLNLAGKQGWNEDSDPQTNSQLATSLIQQMMPVLRHVLRSAVLNYRPDTGTLQEFIQNWQDMGLPLGFQRFSAAVNQVVCNTVAGDPDQPQIGPAIESYIQAAQAFIRNYQADEMVLSQTGAITSYSLEQDDASAILNWNQAGTVTLESFSASSLSPPETAPGEARSIPTKGTRHGTQKGQTKASKNDQEDSEEASSKEG